MNAHRWALLACFVIALNAAKADENAPERTGPQITFVIDEDGRQRFAITGLTAEMLAELRQSEWTDAKWQSLFAVRVAHVDRKLPALLGEYRVEQEGLSFVPRFSPRLGQRYEARLDVQQLASAPADWKSPIVLDFDFSGEIPLSEPAELVAIYPTSDKLPENQLKFYLHFSQSMSRGEAYRHIHLLKENGEEVEFAFLELPEELWDPELKRFTLLLDPGRIKRGLKPREEFGPSLVEGRSYTLVVDATWVDADGQALSSEVRKSFQVVEPDDTQPDPAEWTLTAPGAGTREPLVVRFGEPLDHAMLQRVLHIRHASGTVLKGHIKSSAEETAWHFIPEEPWLEGRYALMVDTRLEDLAGNSIARPFEVDLFDTVQKTVPMPVVQLPFTVSTE